MAHPRQDTFMSNAYLSLSRVDMTFPGPNGGNPVLKGIDLNVTRGEYISLIGHSGCGKSTVLNIVAGLLKASSGGVLLDNREVNAPGPDRRHHWVVPLHAIEPRETTAGEEIAVGGWYDWQTLALWAE